MNPSWFLAHKRETLTKRADIIRAVRSFFDSRNYLEVETPIRIPAPAPEAHIDAVASEGWFLHTSPELCMKRLVAGGFPQIYQICHCFRHGERGSLHLPEFTMLEWYRAGADYFSLMDECEELIRYIADTVGISRRISRDGKEMDISPPWERMTLREAFRRFSPLSLEEVLAADTFDEVLVEYVEPHLGREKPTFLHDYPLAMASLARPHRHDPHLAERFELYMASVEIANAFSELTDPDEQERRFAAEERRRRIAGKVPYPSLEPFLACLPHLPPTAGIALGIDRLVMILTGTFKIDDVVPFTPETL